MIEIPPGSLPLTAEDTTAPELHELGVDPNGDGHWGLGEAGFYLFAGEVQEDEGGGVGGESDGGLGGADPGVLRVVVPERVFGGVGVGGLQGDTQIDGSAHGILDTPTIAAATESTLQQLLLRQIIQPPRLDSHIALVCRRRRKCPAAATIPLILDF